MLLALIDWFIRGRHTFKGPKREVERREEVDSGLGFDDHPHESAVIVETVGGGAEKDK